MATTTACIDGLENVIAELPDRCLRLCVLGGTSIQRSETEQLAGAIAKALAQLEEPPVVFTEGMPGVQQAFMRQSEGLQMVHLVPIGQACSWPGRELLAGKDVKERKAIFSLVGDIYLVLEGGPNVAAQVKPAFRRGAQIIPVMRTGGASSGLFQFPQAALQKPSFAEHAQWALLKDSEASIHSTALAVKALVAQLIEMFPEGCGRDLTPEEPVSPSEESQSPGSSSKPLLPKREPEAVTRREPPPLAELNELRRGSGSGGEAAISSRPPVAEAELRPPRTPPRPRTPTRTVPPLAASERQRAESKRRSARDEWNVQEILLDWAISRHPGRQVRQRFDLPAPLADEAEFRHYFNLIFPSLEIQLWDDNEEDQEPAAQQLLMAFRSADRDGDGFVSVRELHYGIQCAYGYQCLTTNAVRQLAFTPLTAERLQDLMESLNEGFVSAAEVKGVLLEAQLIGEGRQALLWALGSWYVNVQRAETPWLQVLRAAVRRWIPSEEEHHGWMLHDLARMTMEPELSPELAWSQRMCGSPCLGIGDLPKTLPLPKRLGGRPDSTSRASQACILTLAVLIHIFYLCLLVFPAVLFGLMIYLGSEHGDDRCPKDLDALLVWFGALGAASLVMDCANDGKLAISFITWALKISLALMPFLGMAWTHSLQHRDAEMCGPFVFWTSKWIWSALASCELYVLCLLSWSFHVARNHERSLRRAAVSEDENQCPAVSDALLS
ncbi:unnamed protein product [Durusdinium trenchii]|uniref:EF-hand domain-containing protein n=1 Tax=Durusdinium trenchii TaxID=1381693 RepID=A0ABP0IR18_9DINO